MKKNLEIIEFENKATNTEPPKMYVRFNTSEGWMSCFDSVASDKLKQLVGSCASVEVVESKSGDKVFHNIKKCYGNAESDSEDEVEVVRPGKPNYIEKYNQPKNTTMYVSYAKDVFCALITQANEQINTGGQIMETAIALVKQAKEAFE